MSKSLIMLVLVIAATILNVLPARATVVSVKIEPVFNGQPIVPGEGVYVDEHGDTLTIDLLRFYITNVGLVSRGGIVTDSNAHLVDSEIPASYSFDIQHASDSSYLALRFTLGVDSVTNTNGANSGDLDPSKGMYWAWNTGYVMAKLEGRAKVCKTLHHAFEFHIGGYMPPYNTAREIELQLPAALKPGPQKQAVIVIKADIAAWLKGIELATTNSILIPGKQASAMADNYAKMFTISEISQR